MVATKRIREIADATLATIKLSKINRLSSRIRASELEETWQVPDFFEAAVLFGFWPGEE